MRRAFKPGLENELGSHGIEQRLGGFAVAAGFAQAGFGVNGGQALVGKADRQVVATFQAFGELGRQPGHFMWRAVGMHGQANNQLHRLPFGDQLADGGKTIVVRLGMDGGQRMSRTQHRLAGGDTDALFTEIEREDSAHQRADPLMSVRPRRKAG